MADAAISNLNPITLIQDNDLFVLEQNGEAMKLVGSLLKDYINRNILTISVQTLAPTEAAKVVSYNSTTGALVLGLPRGCGIADIEKTDTDVLEDTYTITFEAPAGGSARPPVTFTVTNGRGITDIEKTSGSHAPGTLDTYTITYNDGTTSTFQVYNGQDGEGSPGSAAPLMDGNASSGTALAYSRQDHVHPSDTSRVPITRTINGIALNGNVVTQMVFEDVEAENWTELDSGDTDYNEDFPWRGELPCDGVTSDMVPEVVFSISNAMSGDFAPISKAAADVIYIYAADEPADTVTVLTAIAHKGVTQ